MQALSSQIKSSAISADNVLSSIVKGWVGIALVGQWMFAIYIFTLYALPTIAGNSEVTHEMLPGHGVKDKSFIDSILYFSHILPAALMALSGVFQLFPSIRRKYPKFHRINGRMFFVLAISGALTGLYLTWGAGLRFSDIGSLGVTLNGILIPVAIYFAWRTAIKKQFNLHQRFAVHSFLLVNGVWSFRLYLMGWFITNQGPNGNSANIDGPADITLSFASYLFPMLIAELYFWAKRNRSNRVKWSVSIVAAIGTLITLIGVLSAGSAMWFPRVSKVIEALF